MNTIKNYRLEDKKHRLVRISSEDKAEGGTNSRFKVNLPSVGGSIDRVCGYIVKYASIPNVFPNVPSYANVLEVAKQTGPVVYSVALDVNYYNITGFITELQNKINTAIAPDSVAITLTAENKLNFVWTGDNYKLPDNFLSTSTIQKIVGLDGDIGFAPSFTLPNPVNLIGETEVYIHSRTLHSGGLTEADGNFSVVDVIPLNVQYGGVAYITYPSADLATINYEPYENQKTLRSVDIVLRNRQGKVLELPSNFNFTMMIKIYHD